MIISYTEFWQGKNAIILSAKDDWQLCPAPGISAVYLTGEAADKLSAYEDSGLSPEEIATLKQTVKELRETRYDDEAMAVVLKEIAELRAENARLRENLNEGAFA